MAHSERIEPVGVQVNLCDSLRTQ